MWVCLFRGVVFAVVSCVCFSFRVGCVKLVGVCEGGVLCNRGSVVDVGHRFIHPAWLDSYFDLAVSFASSVHGSEQLKLGCRPLSWGTSIITACMFLRTYAFEIFCKHRTSKMAWCRSFFFLHMFFPRKVMRTVLFG